jgi:hypothetical protein|tara:strand:+ start:1566 stop:1787 length:222 start_codon:yes stop_codon:yes gene_type:complete
MTDNLEIPIEVIKEVCKQSEMWEINNPRVIAMLNNIFKCLKDEENLDEESKETLIHIVFSNMIIYSRYDLNNV